MITTYIAISLLLCWFVVPYVLRRFQVARLRKRCREKRAIVLTYDDGPGARVTPRIKELLDFFGATATFFPLGFKLEASGSLLEGHELGSHSYGHLHAWKNSPISVYEDIHRGIESISHLSSSRLFRPPYGKLTLATLAQIWARRCSIAWWTIDSSDTWPETVPASRILERIERDGGGVILMHDHDRLKDQEREAYVIELTRSVLEFSRTGGFNVCRMSEVMGVGLLNGKSR
jgi:peptidoglycan/xylan/chitin deacetylase (PgdA/CDA1 family)